MVSTFSFYGLPIFSGSFKEIGRRIVAILEKKKHAYVCVSGAHGLVEAMRNPRSYRSHKYARFILPDGMPLVWLGKLLGRPNITRMYGPDVMLTLCRLASQHNYKIFLFGTNETTLLKLKNRLKVLFPAIRIVGCLAPPERLSAGEHTNTLTRRLNRPSPHIVFVGLSTPLQENWMYENRLKVNANIMVGVGAAFDFISGVKRQAPKFIQRSGFEWAFRLATEPGRLWRRYIVAVTGFSLLSFGLLVRRAYRKFFV